jgi:nicotinic acid mononucleotide adenylyltransferase
MDQAKPYQNVAWMGGSYAPPTAAHVNVAIAMGLALLERTVRVWANYVSSWRRYGS